MRLRLRHVPFIAAAGVLAAVAIPGVSQGTTPLPSSAAFVGVDVGLNHAWRLDGSGPNTVTVAAGAVVTISYPSGASSHNAVFTSAQPTCTQTAGTDSGSVPPLPHTPQGAGWSGTCTFTEPGTYGFVCGLHRGMGGSVVVSDGSSTATTTGSTTSTATTTATTTPPTTTSTTTTTPVTTPAPPPAPRLSVVRRQRGTAVRATLTGLAAGTRAEVTLATASASLSAHTARAVTVGRASFMQTAAGARNITVRVSARARAALRRRPLTLTITARLSPRSGTTVVQRATVVLRRR